MESRVFTLVQDGPTQWFTGQGRTRSGAFLFLYKWRQTNDLEGLPNALQVDHIREFFLIGVVLSPEPVELQMLRGYLASRSLSLGPSYFFSSIICRQQNKWRPFDRQAQRISPTPSSDVRLQPIDSHLSKSERKWFPISVSYYIRTPSCLFSSLVIELSSWAGRDVICNPGGPS